MIVDQPQLPALPFSLGRDSLFDICTSQLEEEDGNVSGLLVVDHSWGPKETHCNENIVSRLSCCHTSSSPHLLLSTPPSQS